MDSSSLLNCVHSGWCIIFAINKVKQELSKVKIRITLSGTNKTTKHQQLKVATPKQNNQQTK